MLNWGVMSAGGIAYVFCNAMRFTDSGQILAVGSRTQSRMDRLGSDFDIPRQYTSYEALLADDEIDAIYIATIHPLHAEWAIKCAEAGKHILVEKPISMNHAEAAAMVDAAREHDVFLMEAFMYRCHPQIQRVVQLIQDGVIGDIHIVQARFGGQVAFNPNGRIYNREMGGGGILDLGCYTASAVRLFAGAAEGKLFLHPTVVRATGKVGPTGVDHIAAASLKFENDIVGDIIAAVEGSVGRGVSIHGSEGVITIPNPWLPSSPCRGAKQPLPLDTVFPSSTIIVQPHGDGEPNEIEVTVDRDLFTYEADTVANHIAARQAPAMSWDDTLSNMRLLDTWREQVGVIH
ncbi:gfo/Idh/MocA family oxidoreductase [Candidatus Poribacteria bacterium]|nr:MAG: gfo/Idh/MocA family oxidoreductase [Candidatus Poribacteria bacterium]